MEPTTHGWNVTLPGGGSHYIAGATYEINRETGAITFSTVPPVTFQPGTWTKVDLIGELPTEAPPATIAGVPTDMPPNIPPVEGGDEAAINGLPQMGAADPSEPITSGEGATDNPGPPEAPPTPAPPPAPAPEPAPKTAEKRSK